MTATAEVEQLYRSDRTRLVAIAALVVGNPHSAEEIVQECFARLVTRDLSSIEDLGAYARKMVVRECWARARRGRREVLGAEAVRGLHLDAPLAEFREALATLTPRRRTAVVLRYFCDLPVTEIAELMSARPSTVSSLLNRALRDLREVLR